MTTGMKEKMMEVLTGIYEGAENALKSIVSKRLYVFVALIYLAVSGMDLYKFLGVCVVACVYIWSETQLRPASVGLYSGVKNALKGAMSKRLYVFAALIYLAVSQLDRGKFLGICAVACVYIWSETVRKKTD